jgi:hypothetical protein
MQGLQQLGQSVSTPTKKRVCDAVLSSAKSHQWVNVNGKPVG